MNGLLYIDKPSEWTSFDVVAKIRGKVRAIVRSQHEARGYCLVEDRGKRLRHEDGQDGSADLPKHRSNCKEPCACMEMNGTDAASNGPSRTKGTVQGVTQRADTASRSKGLGQDGSADLPKHRCKCKVKVGHTGTLDPAATGLLIICVGKYTKKVPELIKQDKTYDVEIHLGRESTTADSEGEITVSEQGNALKQPSSSDINDALKKFVGTIQQTPPIYSAIKVDGKRAYDLARKGKKVTLQPRTVHIYSITGTTYDYPMVRFTSRVGSGTYIRSLAVDIGTELQTGAYMSALRRTSIGDITLDQAVSISDITEEYLLKTLH